jgi:xeroderma pigmentosum group C-complementing protein
VRVSHILLIYFLAKPKPSYVLERHLLRDQVISQDAHELGKFRGEPVYSRSQVLQLKAAENWIRHGRVVREGEQPLKYVKQRAATINRRRELEIRAETEGTNNGGAVMQGLYAEDQTEAYVPPPVIDVRSSCCLRERAQFNQGDANNIPRT